MFFDKTKALFHSEQGFVIVAVHLEESEKSAFREGAFPGEKHPPAIDHSNGSIPPI